MLPGFDTQRDISQRRALPAYYGNVFKFQEGRHALV
jgi:hypothetical protein